MSRHQRVKDLCLAQLRSSARFLVMLCVVAAIDVAVAAEQNESTQQSGSPRATQSRPNIVFAFADDWGRYAGIYGQIDGPGSINDVVQTPHIDQLARTGVVFTNAFVNAPSCTPCRSSLLSGQYFYRTGQGAILQGAVWDAEIPTYPLLLAKNGYRIGFSYKVWSPGRPADAGYGGKQNGFHPAGRKFNGFSQTVTKQAKSGRSIKAAKDELLETVGQNFDSFLASNADDQPFCYWFGPTNVHRKWTAGSGAQLWGIDPDSLQGKLPKFLPDVPIVRQDVADYLGEIAAFDAAVGVLLQRLEAAGELENTLIVISGDHGAPGFPRGKCNLYDFGTRVPLIAAWPGKIPGDRVVTDMTTLMDLAPTFLDAGQVEIPDVMTGESLWPILTGEQSGRVNFERSFVITGRERHVAKARTGNLPYPQRAIRTDDFLYIINFEPDRWPMGTPGAVTDQTEPTFERLANFTFDAFADLDASPTKAWIIKHRNDREIRPHYDWAFAKRPAEELYLLAEDPDQLNNLADQSEFHDKKTELRTKLLQVLKETDDPRVVPPGTVFEEPPFAGPESF